MSKLKVLFSFLFVFLISLFFAHSVSAATYTITGTISDNSILAIPDAMLEVLDINTNNAIVRLAIISVIILQ